MLIFNFHFFFLLLAVAELAVFAVQLFFVNFTLSLSLCLFADSADLVLAGSAVLELVAELAVVAAVILEFQLVI
ncbi:hypothetical protein [Rickettsia monacensis]|uniref:hypothetical protein n=1 Tax=Rickettsia monacensis TaxID=109232 RepID=UPI0005633383|nr:hypothetical protein [Rickettsia monacensis]